MYLGQNLLLLLGLSLGLLLSLTLMGPDLPRHGCLRVQGGTGVAPGKLESGGPGPVFLLPLVDAAPPLRLSAIDRLLASSVFLRLPLPGSPDSLASSLSLPLNAACTDGPVVQASIPAFPTVLLLIGFWVLALEGPPVQNSLEGC